MRKNITKRLSHPVTLDRRIFVISQLRMKEKSKRARQTRTAPRRRARTNSRVTIVTRETWTLTRLQDPLHEPLVVIHEQIEIFPAPRTDAPLPNDSSKEQVS
jgi:hypothetical protein